MSWERDWPQDKRPPVDVAWTNLNDVIKTYLSSTYKLSNPQLNLEERFDLQVEQMRSLNEIMKPKEDGTTPLRDELCKFVELRDKEQKRLNGKGKKIGLPAIK